MSVSEPPPTVRTWTAQLKKGLVELCVMGALQGGETYGYEILRRLKDHADQLAITESAVYPILARLAKEGLVQVRAAPSPAGPARRYYRLTSLGRRRFMEMREYWKKLSEAVDGLVPGDKP
jgi:PadR family transcriptional regulator PadR